MARETIGKYNVPGFGGIELIHDSGMN